MTEGRPRRRSRSGFTLIELVIVIVVIGILASITTLTYSGVLQNSHEKLLQTDLTANADILSSAFRGGQFPAQSDADLSASDGDTLSYIPYDLQASYCLQATGFGVSYYVTNGNAKPQKGACTSDLDAVLKAHLADIVASLQAYYAAHGTYPWSAGVHEGLGGDSTGQWALTNLTGISPTDLLSPYDATGEGSSFREEGAWSATAHSSPFATGESGGAHFGWVSTVAVSTRSGNHWTCYQDGDVCIAYRIWYRLSDGVLHSITASYGNAAQYDYGNPGGDTTQAYPDLPEDCAPNGTATTC
jgi:prepilin-type N-terminal cleavage/methylation domain-containing protein